MTDLAIQLSLTFLEGLGLVFSPCILPVLPFVLAGGLDGNKRKPVGIITGFVLCFTVFALLSRTLFAALGIEQDTVQVVSFALLVLLGLVMVVPALEHRFAGLTQGLANKAQNIAGHGQDGGFFSGLMIGSLIGVVWTPCAGPLLAAALVQIAQSGSHAAAAVLLAAFSAGAAIPMLVIALAGRAVLRGAGRYGAQLKWARRVIGVLIIAVALPGVFGVNLGAWIVAQDEAAQVAERKAVFTPPSLKDGLAQPYAAPEIVAPGPWINSEPLKLADLKGKVVLLDFWTYSCINCIRTLPYVKTWYETYKDHGFVVIGVHTPEFAFEREPENVEAAVKRFGIHYPVVMDNPYKTWLAYNNKYWPAHYLIDREGNVVYTHFGEGKYDVTEGNIRYLLGMRGDTQAVKPVKVTSPDQTHETYLGQGRAQRMAPVGTTPEDLALHEWAAKGDWRASKEYLVSGKAGDTLSLHYRARKVFLVMETADGSDATVTVANGTDIHEITVNASRLYDLIELDEKTEGVLTLTINAPGVRLYAFTFES